MPACMGTGQHRGECGGCINKGHMAATRPGNTTWMRQACKQSLRCSPWAAIPGPRVQQVPEQTTAREREGCEAAVSEPNPHLPQVQVISKTKVQARPQNRWKKIRSDDNAPEERGLRNRRAKREARLLHGAFYNKNHGKKDQSQERKGTQHVYFQRSQRKDPSR